MPHFSFRSRQVLVIPCDRQEGCFRYVVSSADGLLRERSSYAYASAFCARLTGEIRAREMGAVLAGSDRSGNGPG